MTSCEGFTRLSLRIPSAFSLSTRYFKVVAALSRSIGCFMPTCSLRTVFPLLYELSKMPLLVVSLLQAVIPRDLAWCSLQTRTRVFQSKPFFFSSLVCISPEQGAARVCFVKLTRTSVEASVTLVKLGRVCLLERWRASRHAHWIME